MRVLVLGGYGLIGSGIVRRLVADGHDVTGLGRSVRKGHAVSKEANWIQADISDLTGPEDWADILDGFDIVVNAAGVLQTGLSDNVVATQETAMIALWAACETGTVRQVIQISAPGVSASSDTTFYRTKAIADQNLKSRELNWVILRPGLVISAQAYGGTGLVRMLAAFPLFQPLVCADTNIQTVWSEDVATAVSLSVERSLSRIDADLVSDQTLTLGEIVAQFRSWLGFRPARHQVSLPVFLAHPIAFGADIAGWLGWRSALRSTALAVLKKDIRGNPDIWRDVSGGKGLTNLEETLRAIPATAQERIYSRVMLAFPVLLLCLSLFWISSGLIGFWKFHDAIAVFGERLPPGLRTLLVAGGSLADILIGLTLLVRPWTRYAAFASILLSVGYLISAAVITPHLWADPLGPMIKVFPAIALALAVSALAEPR